MNEILSFRQYDAASCHAIEEGLQPWLNSERIYFQSLAKSTTGYAQVVDSGGFFRSLKATIKSWGFSNTSGGSAVLSRHQGPVASCKDFWILYKNLLLRYSNLQQFCSLGFSWKQSNHRINKVSVCSRNLNSRVVSLYEEMLQESPEVLEIEEYIAQQQ